MNNQSAFPIKNLSQTYAQGCFSVNVNKFTVGTNIDLFRLRTAANGPIIKAYVAGRQPP